MMVDRNSWLLARYENDKKSLLVCYLLLICFGWLGVHRMYAGRSVSGAVMITIAVVGFVLGALSLGLLWLPFGMVLGIWAFIDLFLLPGIVREFNSELADSYFLPASRRDIRGRPVEGFREIRRDDGPFAVRLHPSDRIGR